MIALFITSACSNVTVVY